MKAFPKSRFVRTLATLVMLARAIARPLSRSIFIHTLRLHLLRLPGALSPTLIWEQVIMAFLA